MYKLNIFMTLLLFSNIVHANQVIFMNKSLRNPVEVSYQYCDSNPGAPGKNLCDSVSSLKINKNSSAIIQSLPNRQLISIISAVESDEYGSKVSEGKYQYVAYDSIQSHCGYPLQVANLQNNVAIILDDMNGSPVIICDAKGYLG